MSFKLPYNTRKYMISALKKSNLFSQTIQSALKQAIISHRYQKRDNGNNYLTEHIYPMVVDTLDRNLDKDYIEYLTIVILLHDTIEDDENFTAKKCIKKFGEEITVYILDLTKKPHENLGNIDQIKAYKVNKEKISKLMTASIISRIVKLEDRLNNISCIH